MVKQIIGNLIAVAAGLSCVLSPSAAPLRIQGATDTNQKGRETTVKVEISPPLGEAVLGGYCIFI